MAKINGVVLTAKKALKPDVREAIYNRDFNKVVTALGNLGFQEVEGTKAIVKTYEDNEGNLVHAVLDFSVTIVHPIDRSARVSKKTTKAEPINFEE